MQSSASITILWYPKTYLIMKVRSIFTYDFAKESNEVYDLEKEPSLTVPDETLSLKEILYRFTNGIVPMEMRELPYDKEGITIDDDVNPMNDSELSLSDIHNLAMSHYSRYQDLLKKEQEKKAESEASQQSEVISSDAK